MADHYLATDMALPFNLEAEQSILGAILIDASCIGSALNYIKPDCFYQEQHKKLFTIILTMYTSGEPVDYVTVYNHSLEEKIFDNAEEAKIYLARLMEMVPSVNNIEVYCKIVQDKFYVRSLMMAASDIIAMAGETSDAKTLLDAAEQRIYEIRQGKSAHGLIKIDEVLVEVYDKLQKLSSDDNENMLGIPTGFKQLDMLIHGLNASDLILLAARPAMGKTSFALNLAANAAFASKKDVAVFSLEMSKQQLVERMLASESLIDSNEFKTGEISDWVKVAKAASKLSSSSIYIDDTPGMTVAEMKAKLRRLNNLGLVVIDYLQLMSSGRRSENRVQEVSEMTRNLKIMAKEMDVPVVSLSQLSRGPEARADHRPMLSDLRESGSIEQDADIVMFLYRDAYYNPDTEEQNIAECIVAKNRHGEVGTVKLGWDGAHTRFNSLDYHHVER